MRVEVLVFIATIQLTTGAGKYNVGDTVEVYVNKVGPYANVHETYHYYELPVCSPDKIEHKILSLGEVLDGDRMAKSLYEIKYKESKKDIPLCTKTYSEKDLARLKEAIEEQYYFEFVIDELPIHGFIGHFDEEGVFPHVHKTWLFTHLVFNIHYNGENIILVNVTVNDEHTIDITEEKENLAVTFFYTVNWKPTKETLKERGAKLKHDSFFPKTLEIHWLSVMNSMILVSLLIGFVVVILSRVLKNDFARYNDELDGEDLDQEDNGWKIIHTDVFRFPRFKSLFCAILGVGTQFLTIITGCLFLALLGTFNVHKHGQLNTAGIILYAFTSCVSGYVAAHMYRLMDGEKWVWNINLTSLLFVGPLFLFWSVINSVAWAYGSTQALPWTTILLLMSLWLFVGYPLTVVGGVVGKNWAGTFDSPCRTKNIARELPTLPWYRSALIQFLMGGFLPFSSISVELYYIFATIWGYEHYTLYGILTIVYIMALIVTACITVALTYFQLNAEDYRWWWRSVFTSGSASVFVFCYSIFYFLKRSNMSGALQTMQFFGYTSLTCYVFFLTLGTVGFFSSLKFVRYIYTNVKMD